MYRLYLHLRDRAEPPTEQEKAIAARRLGFVQGQDWYDKIFEMLIREWSLTSYVPSDEVPPEWSQVLQYLHGQ